MYKVIKYFTDLTDNGYAYHVGDKYPRDGLIPSAERINALLSGQNKRKAKFIKRIEEEPQRAADTAKQTAKTESKKKTVSGSRTKKKTEKGE